MNLGIKRTAEMILKAAFVSSASLYLSACATPPPRVITKTVSVPVSVKCTAEVSPKPAYAADAVSLDGTIFALVQALLIDREQRKAREAELEAARAGCS